MPLSLFKPQQLHFEILQTNKILWKLSVIIPAVTSIRTYSLMSIKLDKAGNAGKKYSLAITWTFLSTLRSLFLFGLLNAFLEALNSESSLADGFLLLEVILLGVTS